MPDANLEFSLTDSFERNPDGAVLLDRDWVIRHANRSAALFLGRELTAMIDAPLQQVLPGWWDSELGDAIRSVATTREPLVLPPQMVAPNVWVAPRVMPNRSGFTIVLRDTSEMKRIELALGERERQYRFLSESLPQQLWTATPDGRLDFVNLQVEAYFGRTSDQMLADGWQAVLYPADLDACLPRWLHSLATGEPYEVEFRLRDAAGVYRWHLARARAMRDESGQIVRWFGANTDIDEHKRVEQAHRFLLDASAVLSSSLEFEVTLASIARLSVPHVADWCSVHLLDDGELRQVAVAHVDPSRVTLARELARRYPIDLAADPTGVAHVLRTGRSELIPEIDDAMLVAGARDAEHLRIARDLGLRSWMCVPLRSRQRGTIGAITLVASESGRRFGPADLAVAEELANRCALAIDGATLLRQAQAAELQARQLSEELERRVAERTGELVRARDRIAETNARLRELDSTKDELIGALSFQLTSPLDAILGDADNLLEGTGFSLREDQRAVVRRISSSSRLMLSLVHDLLDRSRMANGKFVLDRTSLDVCIHVRDVLATLAPILATQGLRVVTRFPDAPALASADPQRLEQVLIAMLHNALQISEPGALLRVAVDIGADEIRVEVQHTGERIAEATVAGVFQRFTRHEGAWLGLPTAQGILAAHAGRIGIEPGATGGNVFWFTLPRLHS